MARIQLITKYILSEQLEKWLEFRKKYKERMWTQKKKKEKILGKNEGSAGTTKREKQRHTKLIYRTLKWVYPTRINYKCFWISYWTTKNVLLLYLDYLNTHSSSPPLSSRRGLRQFSSGACLGLWLGKVGENITFLQISATRLLRFQGKGRWPMLSLSLKSPFFM